MEAQSHYWTECLTRTTRDRTDIDPKKLTEERGSTEVKTDQETTTRSSWSFSMKEWDN